MTALPPHLAGMQVVFDQMVPVELRRETAAERAERTGWHRMCYGGGPADPDELCIVALYRDRKLCGYVLARFRDGEWQSDEVRDHSWGIVDHGDGAPLGLMFRSFPEAEETV